MASQINELIITVGSNEDDFAISFKKEIELTGEGITQTAIHRSSLSAKDLPVEIIEAANLLIDHITDLGGASKTRLEVVNEAKAKG